MREFTPQMTAALTDLFMATGGQVGRFYAVPDAALTTYEALLRYRLVVLQNHEAGLVTRWTAALTDDGRRFFLEYNQLDESDVSSLPVRESMTLTFNLRDENEARIYEWLQTVSKSGTLLSTLHDMITLHAVLESGHIEALLATYPQLADYLQQRINAQVDERDTQQMSQVLSEIEAMKTLLKQQHRGHPAPLEAPAPKPIGLKPVVPLTPPETAPRQLSVPQFEVPKYDDEEDDSQDLFIITTDVNAGRRANENFLKSVLSLQEEDENEGKR
jgi:hypothetical protein